VIKASTAWFRRALPKSGTVRVNSRSILAGFAPPRMRVVVDCEKCGAIGRREVTDLENGFEMLGRDRHRVGRVDQLRHEGTVGAKRDREAPARPRRAVVADGLEQALIVSDRLAPDGIVHGVASRKSTAAIACLAAATD
jgi:hypothetical protein